MTKSAHSYGQSNPISFVGKAASSSGFETVRPTHREPEARQTRIVPPPFIEADFEADFENRLRGASESV
jgi:hypothetical protein